jgi:type IV secretory pathway VirB2 component (pilin)
VWGLTTPHWKNPLLRNIQSLWGPVVAAVAVVDVVVIMIINAGLFFHLVLSP